MFDDLPKPKPTLVIGENLESISVDELLQRIMTLEEEIRRVRTEIDKKQLSKTAADAFFKT